jgi:hypothetical protein
MYWSIIIAGLKKRVHHPTAIGIIFYFKPNINIRLIEKKKLQTLFKKKKKLHNVCSLKPLLV